MSVRSRLLFAYSRWRSWTVPGRGRLLRFAGIALAVLIVIALLWQFIAPAYNQLLVWTSSGLVPHEATLAAEGRDIIVDVEMQGPEIWATASGTIEGSALHYGLILLLALIAATPGLKLSRRAKFGAVALLAMFLIHVIAILVATTFMVSNVESGGYLASNPFMILFLTIGCDLFPLLIWGGLSFRYWFPRPQRVAQTTKWVQS